MNPAHRTGRLSEDLAVDFLAARGWRILHRNFRDGPREIDVVARRGDLIAFVEVKGRATTRHHHPADAIGPYKRRDLARAAKAWIRRHGQATESYRFDVVTVLGPASGRPDIDHIEDAWRM